MNRIVNYKFFFLVTISVISCKNNIQQKIINHYNHYSNAGTCTVLINDLTVFEWDKMYVFGSSATEDFISGTINFPYIGKPILNGFRRILFTWGKTKMYDEDYRPYSYQNSAIDFENIQDSILHIRAYSFSQNDAFFEIAKEKIRGSCKQCFLYILIPQEKKNASN